MLFSSYKKYWQFLLNIIACFVIAITLLFVGLLISYAFFLPISSTPDLTFFGYIDAFFSGTWGVTSNYVPGTPITELVGSSRLYRMIEFLWVPILLGLIGGIALGRTSFKLRGKWRNKVIQLSIAIGIAFPIFFLGMMLQYNVFIGGETHSSLTLFLGRLPAIGFKSPWYPDPTEITGFPILDARLSGQIYLAIDRIEHLILPIFTLTPIIIAFVAWRTRSNMERKQNEKSILSHTMKTVMIFGFISTFYLLIDLTFNLHGMSEVFLLGKIFNDANIIRGVIFVFLIFLVVLTFVSSIVYSVVAFLKFDRQHVLEKNSPSLQSDELIPSVNKPGTNSRRGKARLIALVAGVLCFIGFLTPYVWLSVMGITAMYWSWGLVSIMGMTVFVANFAVSGILILIGAILLIATGFLSKKREDLKIIGIIWIAASILSLVGVLIPLGMGMRAGLSIGFYLPLFGSIIGIIAGALVLFVNLYFDKYPLVLLGLIVTIGIIVCAIFAELISGYTLAEANVILPGSWDPPSEGHVLGQTRFGYDVFARILYGLRGILLFGFEAVFIGLAGGIIFGFISSLHRYVNRVIEVILIITCIIPVIIVIPLFISIFGFGHIIVIPAFFGFPIDLITLIIGIILIPIFTRGIANVPLRKRNILISLKKMVIYIPLAFGIFVLIYESLAFLGFSDWNFITLGSELTEARLHLYDAPWATIWPGLFIFFTAFGSFILHYGLKNAFLEKLTSTRITDNFREIKYQMN